MAEILRPMSTGELMDRTLVLYKKNIKLFLGIASVGPATYLLFELLTIGSASVEGGTPNRLNPFASTSAVLEFMAGLVVMLAGMALAHAATVRAVAAVHLGQPIGIWEAYRSLKGKLLRVFGVFISVALLAGLAAFGAMMLIFMLMLMIRTIAMVDPGRTGQVFAALVGIGTGMVGTYLSVRALGPPEEEPSAPRLTAETVRTR